MRSFMRRKTRWLLARGWLRSEIFFLILSTIRRPRRRSTASTRSEFRRVAASSAISSTRWDEKAGLRGMRYAPNVRRAQGTMKRRPAMKKTSTVRVNENMIFKGHKLTIGLDLGDHWSCYCVLDEAGKIILEQKVATTPEAMKKAFAKIPRSLIALETGTHSPWVSRLLKELGYKVIVAHAQKVQLITKSSRRLQAVATQHSFYVLHFLCRHIRKIVKRLGSPVLEKALHSLY